MKIDFSVIIPHANSLDTLSRAINSVPNEEYIEVIVVDNSPKPISKGDIKDINRDFTLLYSASSRGAGGARNVGIEHAKGDFLLFMDSDDFFVENVNEILTDFLNNNPEKDICFYNVTAKDSKTLQPSSRANYYNKLFDEYVTLPSEKRKDKILYRYTTPWGKIYKRMLIINHGIKFDEVPASNDVMFTEYASYFAQTTEIRKEVLYVVTTRNNSLTTTPNSINLRSRFTVQMRQSSFLKEIGKMQYALVPFGLFIKLWKVRKKDFVWAIKEMIKYKINPFYIIYLKYKYKLK